MKFFRRSVYPYNRTPFFILSKIRGKVSDTEWYKKHDSNKNAEHDSACSEGGLLCLPINDKRNRNKKNRVQKHKNVCHYLLPDCNL